MFVPVECYFRLPNTALKFSIKGANTMSFVSTNNKSGMGGLTTTTPPITGENSGTTAGSVAGSVAGAAEAAVEQALGSLMGDLPEPSGLVKAAVAAAARVLRG